MFVRAWVPLEFKRGVRNANKKSMSRFGDTSVAWVRGYQCAQLRVPLFTRR